jgi:23S rRNA (guanosine2251-2'-O)-methyltransferase
LTNPHSILAALSTRPRDVVEIRLHTDHPKGAWEEVVSLAAKHRIPLQHGGQARKGGRRPRSPGAEKSGRSETGAAVVKERSDVSLMELFADSAERAGGHGLWLALDQLQDPHNVGAVFRAAAFFGVQGIVLTRDRSAPLNATVYDVASGGLEHVPFSQEPNLSRALDQAKKGGLWVLGTSEHAEEDVSSIPRDRPWLLVLGNEEKGIRRLTRDKCDLLCRLTPRSEVTSLNVSVAAGVLIARFTGAV